MYRPPDHQIRAWHRPLQNRYEAGQRYSRSRSYIPAFTQDARFDADSATRVEIVRKSRYFERNSAVVNRLADLFEQFTVGTGLQIMPASSDERWNQAADLSFNRWATFADIASRQSWGTLQSLIARTWFIDGEVFLLKLRDDKSPRYPRLQLIEGHRIATPTDAPRGALIVDGIQVNPANGRPEAYWVARDYDGKKFEPIAAADVIHIFEPGRAGMYRGLPFLYPVMNDLHDLDDLQLLEMQAAKDAARTSRVIKTATGEISDEDLIRDTTLTNADGDDATKYYKTVFQSEVQVLRAGDTMEQFASQRPTVAAQWYWRHLLAKVCAGVGIPVQLAFPDSVQGTVERAELDIAAGFFRSRSSVLAGFFREVFIHVIDTSGRIEPEIATKPADWTEVEIVPPRAPNVDVGRNSAAMLAELEAGATTYSAVYGPLGKNWRRELRQWAVEAAYRKALAKEFKIEPEEVKPPDTKEEPVNA